MSMLTSVQQRKAKITLSDYSYRQEIENRMLMAHLTVFDVQVLHEIVHHSLKISVAQLAEELAVSVDSLLPVLDKLSATQLFKRSQLTLIVDKDLRRYFEFQLEKFSEDFVPDLEYLQNVLSRVPIHVLPLWYAIPRSSDNIFESIVEKFFSTPKTYLQYLSELQFDSPILHSIMNDVYQAPHFKMSTSDLMEKYQLSRECLEESLLLLEYHFACCLSYNQIDGRWEEVITPFYELQEYLKFESQAKVNAIHGTIEKTNEKELSYIQDMASLIRACQTKKVMPEEIKGFPYQKFGESSQNYRKNL